MPEDAYHNAFLTGSYPQSQWSHASNGQHMNPTFIGDPAHVGSVHGGDRGAVAPEAIPTSNRPGFIGSLQAAHHPGIVGFPPGARPADNEGVDHYAAAAPQPAFTSANGLDAINYLQAAHSSGIFGFPPGARLTNNEGVSHYAATAPEPAFTSANHSGIVGSFNESFVPPAQPGILTPSQAFDGCAGPTKDERQYWDLPTTNTNINTLLHQSANVLPCDSQGGVSVPNPSSSSNWIDLQHPCNSIQMHYPASNNLLYGQGTDIVEVNADQMYIERQPPSDYPLSNLVQAGAGPYPPLNICPPMPTNATDVDKVKNHQARSVRKPNKHNFKPKVLVCCYPGCIEHAFTSRPWAKLHVLDHCGIKTLRCECNALFTSSGLKQHLKALREVGVTHRYRVEANLSAEDKPRVADAVKKYLDPLGAQCNL